MGRLRRSARWTATSLGVLLVLVAIGLIVLQTAWFKNWLRTQLVAQAATVLNGELRVGTLGGGLWKGVTLDRVELWQANRRVLSADRIRVAYNWRVLARRDWIFDDLVLEKPVFEIVETAEGWNILHLTRPRTTAGAPLDLAIRRLRMTGADITIFARDRPPRRLTNVDLDGALTVDRGVADLRVVGLRGHDEVSGLTVRDLSGTASDNFRAFEVRFLADSPGTSISGTARGTTTPSGRAMDTSLDLTHLDYARLFDSEGPATDLTGHLNLHAVFPSANDRAYATYEFSGSRSAAFGYAADAVNATGRIDGDRVTFDARLAGYGARATSIGAWRFGDAPGSGFAGRGAFSAVDMRRLPESLRLPRLETVLAGRYDATATRHGWRADAILDASVVEGTTISPGTIGHITSSPGVTLYSAGGILAHLNLNRVSGPLQIPALAEPRFTSDLSGRFYVMGREAEAAPRWLVGGATLEGSTLSGTKLTNLHATVDWLGRRLAVDAHGTFEQLNDATLGLRDTALGLSGDVDAWLAIRDLDAPLTGANFEADGRIVLGSSTVRDVAIDAATLDGRITDGLATIRTLQARGPDARLDVTGSYGLGDVAGTGLKVVAEVPDVSILARRFNQPLTGVAVVEATIEGTATSPTASGVVTLRQGAYSNLGRALVTTTTFTAEWPNRDRDRLSWQLNSDSSFVEIGAQKFQRVQTTAAGGLREITIDVEAEQQNRSLGLEGVVALKPDSQELRLRRLALSSDGVAWSLPAGREATLRYGGGRLEVADLTLERGLQHLGISGAFDLSASATPRPGTAAGLEVAMRGIELADLNRVLPGTRAITGRLDGTVRIHGTRQSPVVDADITVAEGTVEGVPFAAATGRVGFSDRRLVLDALLTQAPGVELRAKGTVPFALADGTGGGGLDLTITGGPVHLGLAQAFTPELTGVAGTAAIDLRVTGSLREPTVNGTVSVDGGAFEVPATGARYRDITAQLAFSGAHLGIGRLQMADADGDLLTAEGGLDVLGDATLRGVDMRIRAANVNVLRNRLGTADVDLDIRVAGTLAAPIITGSAALNSGRLEVAPILDRATSRRYSTDPQAALSLEPPAVAPAPARPTLFDAASIDVQLRLPDNLVLRGRDLRVSNAAFAIGDMNIVAGGTFDLTKPPGAPIEVLGTLEVVRGTYTFQGRRFDVNRGSDVRFRGGPVSDPFLNISATREVSGITAEVRLRGTARVPEVTVASRPPLDEGDILSLIVFDQPINSLGAAERVNLGERAAAFAAGTITSPLANSIAQALSLDLLEIQAPTSEGGTGAVEIGGRLGSRVFVGLRQQFGRDEASLLSLEYRVSQVLRFVTSVAQGSLQAHATRRVDQGGVDLIFVIRY